MLLSGYNSRATSNHLCALTENIVRGIRGYRFVFNVRWDKKYIKLRMQPLNIIFLIKIWGGGGQLGEYICYFIKI